MPSDSNNTKHIIIANDLLTGRSVYLTHQLQWSESVADAGVSDDGDTAETRLQVALQDQDKNIVIDPYLVEVSTDGGIDAIRELIRTTGPTVLSADINADAA